MTSVSELPGALVGGCQCGAVRYRVTGPPRRVYCCHCTECRRQSASAFGISVIVPAEAFRLTAGIPRRWSRATASGRLDCHFCPECGTRLWHEAEPADGAISVKGGSLDSPPSLATARHIWTASMLDGVLLPAGAETFSGEPPED